MRHNARSHSAKTAYLIIALGAISLALSVSPAARGQKRATAHAQFLRAQQLHAALDARPEGARTLAEYKRVVAAYRKVYLITPQAAEVTPALMVAAGLYREMGRRFDPIYFQSAIDTYSFLLHEYPSSRHSSEALLSIALLEEQDLHQSDEAETALQQLLRRYPRSQNAGAARQALEQIADTRREGVQIISAEAPEQSAEQVQGIPRVTGIRAWNAQDYTRVVVDLNGDVKYDSARIKNPDRIYFDLYQAQLSPSLANKSLDVQNGLLKAIRVAQNKAGVVRLVLDVESVQGYSAFLLPNPYRLVIDVHGRTNRAHSRLNPSAPQPANSGRGAGKTPPVEEAGVGVPEPTEKLPNTSSGPLVIPSVPPKPMRDGERSLTRALGLKISRIVIDPGHGGYDTGTIGSHGLMEKDVCLDVALRLGKMIQQKLPGAQVIYTRKDDAFVPLEERTAIANQAKADLFISIHANSSHDRDARGVETYYLNFATSPDALEVASRENAISQVPMHDLQDLIKKIARNDKIEESKELATDIQDALAQRLRQVSRSEKNRGVKKAPFVVLIGADMPSVLAEVSFLSNPADERMLEKPADRERIAQGLFRGVASYLSNLNSLNYDRQKLVSDRRIASSASRDNPK